VTSHIHVLRPLGPTDPPGSVVQVCSRQTCRPASPLGHLSGLKPLSRGLSRALRYRQRITSRCRIVEQGAPTKARKNTGPRKGGKDLSLEGLHLPRSEGSLHGRCREN
jgi:hypothetical protein